MTLERTVEVKLYPSWTEFYLIVLRKIYIRCSKTNISLTLAYVDFSFILVNLDYNVALIKEFSINNYVSSRQ